MPSWITAWRGPLPVGCVISSKHVKLTRCGTLELGGLVWRGYETPLESTAGKVMKVESQKVDPSFSMRTTTLLPPLDWFTGDQ